MTMNKFLVFLLTIATCLIQLSLKAQEKNNVPSDKILDKVVAVVGNKMILLSEVEEVYFQQKARGMRIQENEKCRIFEEALFEKMLVVQAQIDSIEVTEKEVEATVDGKLNDVLKQFKTQEAIEEYFGKKLVEIKESFKSPVHDQLLAQKMQREITADIKITPSEVKKFFNELPKDSLPLIDATYEISQIVRKPKISDEEIKTLKNKLNGLRDRIVNKGESFKTLAVLYSQDPGTARTGGLMSNVNKGTLVPEFSSVVFNLEVGEVSEIFETEFGYHIAKLEARHGDLADFRHILMVPQASADAKYKAKLELDSIANVIRTDTLTFKQAALKFSDDEDTKLNGGEKINPYTGTNKFEAKHIDPSINFALRKIKVGEISEAFEGRSGSSTAFMIILLKKHSKAHTVNMNDDYQLIQDMALNNKKQEAMDKWLVEKQKTTYIKLEDDFKDCKFNYPGWIK